MCMKEDNPCQLDKGGSSREIINSAEQELAICDLTHRSISFSVSLKVSVSYP